MSVRSYDFSGWATKNGLKCSDGRIIKENAFKHNSGTVVPLVWNHDHNSPLNVLGHALLENRKEGVYAYCSFNDTESGQNARLLVEHGDVESLSIYANQLKQNGPSVLHGMIREVSLVLSGANPGAFIDNVIKHGETSNTEAIIRFSGDDIIHAEGGDIEIEIPEVKDEVKDETIEPEEEKEAMKNMAHAETEQTVADVFDTLTETQKTVVYALIGQALEDAGVEEDDNGGEEKVKHNVFDNDDRQDVLMHADVEAIFADGKRYGSLRDSALAHGVTDIDYLFPDAQNVNNTPNFIQRDMGWVQKVMSSVHNTPFSRIKSVHADITADEARAKGYVKGNLKIDEVFSLLKRSTTPTTIYKKQKLERDDVIDITDFDVVAWLKAEMRIMLDEEIARAALVGDGRLNASDDKINELNIRPIWTDADLYTVKTPVVITGQTTADEKAKAFIRAAIKARKNYKGSGEPTLYTNEDVLTDCLLLEDTTGRVIYDSIAKLATALRVKEIVTVPVMEGLIRSDDDYNYTLGGIIVNLVDYNIGADKGGAVNLFDDFDIDYNAQKYLIETRCSGALTKPYSALAMEFAIAK